MADIVPQVLIVTSWITNCCHRRKEKKRPYEQGEDLLFFRPPEAKDSAALKRLSEHSDATSGDAAQNHTEATVETGDANCLVAVRPLEGVDTVVGVVRSHPLDGTEQRIDWICVESSQRQKGTAKRLLQAFLIFVQQRSPQIRGVRVRCQPRLVPLFQKAGFQTAGNDTSAAIDGKIELYHAQPTA